MTLFDFKKIRESIHLSESIKDMAEKGQDIIDSLKDQNIMDTLKAKSDELAVSRKDAANEKKIAFDTAKVDQRHSEAIFSVRDALRIMYCLMLIDGTVIAEEQAKYSEIGRAYDQDFDIYKKQLIDECSDVAQSESVQGVEFISLESVDSEEYYEQLAKYVGDLIKEEYFYRTEGVRAKELLWDLLAIAYSEDDYSENERRLIRFVAEKSGVDHAILRKMHHELLALIDIDKEENAVKSLGKSDEETRERLAELARRKKTIMKGIDAMISE